MEMGHQLPSLFTAVDYQAVAGFGDAFLLSKPVGDGDHVSHQGRLLPGYLGQRSEVFFGNDQQVHRRLGVDVAEGNYLFILVYDVAGYFTGDDVAEHAVHLISPIFFDI